MNDFKDFLKDYLIEKSYSLRKLAKESLVSENQLSRYLRGAYPTINVAMRLCKYFDCSFDYIFGLSDIKGKYIEKQYNKDIFLERYLKILKQNNITHYLFAKKTGLSESSLRHWKYGDIPRVESLILIATTLSTSIDYLLGIKDS